MSHMEELRKMKKEYSEISPPPQAQRQVQEAIDRARAEKHRKERMKRIKSWGMGMAAAAALLVAIPNISSEAAYAMSNVPVLGAIVEVVTFREYHALSEDQRYAADVRIPQLDAGDINEAMGTDGEVIRISSQTLEAINREMEEIAQRLIDDFEADMAGQEGYEQLVIDYEVIHSEENYITVKLITYVGAGSGYEQNFYYTIDLHNGQQLALADLFEEDADYITPISENIKAQMRQRMEEDADTSYWIDSEEGMDSWDFTAIDAEQSFYMNEAGKLVITFSEGDVAPMYMGCVEFIIPDDVIKDIRSNAY